MDSSDYNFNHPHCGNKQKGFGQVQRRTQEQSNDALYRIKAKVPLLLSSWRGQYTKHKAQNYLNYDKYGKTSIQQRHAIELEVGNTKSPAPIKPSLSLVPSTTKDYSTQNCRVCSEDLPYG